MYIFLSCAFRALLTTIFNGISRTEFDGCTLVPAGAIFFRDSGYAVGGFAIPVLFHPEKGFTLAGEKISEHAAFSYLEQLLKRNQPVGIWANDEDGTIYFDAVEWFDLRDLALRAGEENGELSIWDITEGKEIRLTANVKQA